MANKKHKTRQVVTKTVSENFIPKDENIVVVKQEPENGEVELDYSEVPLNSIVNEDGEIVSFNDMADASDLDDTTYIFVVLDENADTKVEIPTTEFLSESIKKIKEILEAFIRHDTDTQRSEAVKCDVLRAISCYQDLLDDRILQAYYKKRCQTSLVKENSKLKQETVTKEKPILEKNSKVVEKRLSKRGTKRNADGTVKTPNDFVERLDDYDKTEYIKKLNDLFESADSSVDLSKSIARTRKSTRKKQNEGAKQSDIVELSSEEEEEEAMEDAVDSDESFDPRRENNEELEKGEIVFEDSSSSRKLSKNKTRYLKTDEEKELIFSNTLKPNVEASLSVSRNTRKRAKRVNTQLKKEVQRFTCEYCNVSFTSSSYLVPHFKRCLGMKQSNWTEAPEGTVVEDGDKMVCNHCGKMFSNRYNLRRHLITHSYNLYQPTRAGFIKLDLPDQVSSDEEVDPADDAAAKGGGEPMFDAEHNRELVKVHRSAVEEIIDDHVTRKDKRENTTWCEPCARNFRNVFCLRRHNALIHRNELPYACNHCDNTFTTMFGLKTHTISKHKISANDGKNLFLGNRVNFKGMKYPKYGQVKLYSCRICARVFLRSDNLRTHELRHVGLENMPSKRRKTKQKTSASAENQCKICKKLFKTYSQLRLHLVTHSTERLFHCTKCQKSFKTNASLNLHVKNIHSIERLKVVCDICGQSYSNEANLKKHKLIHSGVRSYHCEWCGKSFIQSDTLKTHIRTHTGEQPWECIECRVRFSERRKWLIHMNDHRGIKPYKCDLCDEAFVDRRLLNKHKLEHTDSRKRARSDFQTQWMKIADTLASDEDSN